MLSLHKVYTKLQHHHHCLHQIYTSSQLLYFQLQWFFQQFSEINRKQDSDAASKLFSIVFLVFTAFALQGLAFFRLFSHTHAHPCCTTEKVGKINRCLYFTFFFLFALTTTTANSPIVSISHAP